MSIKDDLKEKGYCENVANNIFEVAEAIVDDIIENHPMPDGLETRDYMVMAAAATAASILSQVKPEKLEIRGEVNK